MTRRSEPTKRVIPMMYGRCSKCGKATHRYKSGGIWRHLSTDTEKCRRDRAADGK